MSSGDTNRRARKVYGDFFLGYQTREVSGGAKVWRLYYPNYELVSLAGDLYQTADSKQIIATVYPYEAPYDTTDRNIIEYHILLGKVVGLDGFMCEWCYHTPNGEYHGDAALLAIAQMGAQHDFEVGVNWITACEFTSADGRRLFDSRAEAMDKIKDDLVWLVKNVYEPHQGAYVDGRPLILVFSAGGKDTDDIAHSWLGPSDFDTLNSHGQAHGFSPSFIARGFAEELLGRVDGFFTVVTTHDPRYNSKPAPADQEPWTQMISREGQCASAEQHYADLDSHSDKINVRVGAAWRGFEDQKEHSWAYGTKCYAPYDDGQTLRDTWDIMERADVDVAFLWTWNDCAEATSIIPSREAGYRDMEETAERVARFKGIAAASPALLRMPERLLHVRRGVKLLQAVGVGDLEAIIAKADEVNTALCARDERAAQKALGEVEALLATALRERVSRKRVGAEWTFAGGARGLQCLQADAAEAVSFAGKSGLGFAPDGSAGHRALGFRVTDEVRELLQSGHFVGRLEIEFLDNARNWIAVQVDADDERNANFAPGLRQTSHTHYTGHDSFAEIANFRIDGVDAWRCEEMDCVNARFVGGLDGADIEVWQETDTGSALRGLRLEGDVYSAGPPAPQTPAKSAPQLLWAAGGGGVWQDYAYDAACLSDGGVAAVGEFWKAATFGETTLRSAGASDGCVVCYDSDGGVRWAARMGGPYADRATDVWEADGAVCVSGMIFGLCSFGEGAQTVELFAEEESPFLARYDASTGQLLSARLASKAVWGACKRLAPTADGGMVRAGLFRYAVAGTDLLSRGQDDVLVERFSADGGLEWMLTAGGPGRDWANAVAVSADGARVVVAGVFEGEANFGEGANVKTLTSAGEFDMFVACYGRA